jgi:hypothetical protein
MRATPSVDGVLRMPVVARCQDGRPHDRPRGANATGLQVWVGSLTQERYVKCLLRHDALESCAHSTSVLRSLLMICSALNC